jgi:hypothetical protein
MTTTKACIFAGFFFYSLLLGGCALVTPQTRSLKEHRPPDIPEQVELSWVQFFPQDDYQCGPTALATALKSAGLDVTPEMLVEQVYLPARHGSLQLEMLAAARSRGMVAYPLAKNLEDVLREVAAQTPVIVLLNLGVSFFPIWHYSVVVGYDLTQSEFVLRSGDRKRLILPFGVFEYTWKDSEYWAMVAIPPTQLPATATETGYTQAVLALEKTGQVKAAKTAYSTLLNRWPTSLSGLIGAGNVAYSMGDMQAAEAAFRKAAEIHPDSAAALNNLAQTLADQNRLSEAVVVARRAVELGGPLQETSKSTLESIARKMETK